MNFVFKDWIKAAGVRALKTVADRRRHYWNFRCYGRGELGTGGVCFRVGWRAFVADVYCWLA